MTQICIDVQALLSSCFIKLWSESDASKKVFVALEHNYSNRYKAKCYFSNSVFINYNVGDFVEQM